MGREVMLGRPHLDRTADPNDRHDRDINSLLATHHLFSIPRAVQARIGRKAEPVSTSG
jgi:hypothetical protein